MPVSFHFQAVTERKFEELNSFKATAEEELHSLRTELRDVREVTEQLTREFQNFKQNVERQLDELKGLVRGKLEQKEEQEEAAGKDRQLQWVDDIQASTDHKRPLFKKIRGIFRSTRRKKRFYKPSTQEELSPRNGIEEFWTPKRHDRRHDSSSSQFSFEITAFSSPLVRTYSNQSLPILSCRFYQDEIEHPDEIRGRLRKTKSLYDMDSDEPPESIIMEHPSDQAQEEGLRVEFKCLGQDRNMTYQWYKDGIPLRGKQSPLLVLDPVKLIDFGYYVCQVSSRDGLEDSRPATLDVIPHDGMRLQLLNEVFDDFLETRETVEKLLVTEVPGLGGWRQVAHKYKMRKIDIDVLKGRQDAGATVISSIIAHNPELTVYDFCKTLKKSKIRRLDIVKELRGHLLVPKECQF